ncbi:MAG: cobalt ABC transporter permease [Nitrospirota bacterium]
MKTQESDVRRQKNKYRIRVVLVCVLFSVLCSLAAFGSEKWSGVDESVVEKFAKEHGREAREPLINTDQGDLLLFVFLIAGAIGGFIAGYSWRKLIEQRQDDRTTDENHALSKTTKG